MIGDELQKWIFEHLDDDPLKLRMKYRGDELRNFAILQIECRKKAAVKLRETLSNPRFVFPTSLSAEQSTSDIVAHFHASLVSPGDRVLDMTCGLGIDTFHLASVASWVDACEVQPQLAEAARYNASVLGHSNVSVHCCDCVSFLETRPSRSYDTVFIDPARRGEGGKRLYALSDCLPDVVSLQYSIARTAPRLIVKASPMLDITQTLRELPHTRDIYVIGTPTECKELTAVVDFSDNDSSPSELSAPTIHAVTLLPEGVVNSWSYRSDDRDKGGCGPEILLSSLPGRILYEPYPSVMKAGGMERLVRDFPGLSKFHPSTHLFVSDRSIPEFPGRRYGIVEAVAFSSSEIKRMAARRLKVNVTVRNFPLPSQAVVKKLHVTEGGTERLFVATLPDGPVMVLTRPIGQ